MRNCDTCILGIGAYISLSNIFEAWIFWKQIQILKIQSVFFSFSAHDVRYCQLSFRKPCCCQYIGFRPTWDTSDGGSRYRRLVFEGNSAMNRYSWWFRDFQVGKQWTIMKSLDVWKNWQMGGFDDFWWPFSLLGNCWECFVRFCWKFEEKEWNVGDFDWPCWNVFFQKIPGDPELVMILLRGGAEHLRSSASGQTALDFARTEEVPGLVGKKFTTGRWWTKQLLLSLQKIFVKRNIDNKGILSLTT